MNPHLPKRKSFSAGEFFASLVALTIIVVVPLAAVTLLLLWLVPIATAGAVVLGVWQSLAVAVLLALAVFLLRLAVK